MLVGKLPLSLIFHRIVDSNLCNIYSFLARFVSMVHFSSSCSVVFPCCKRNPCLYTDVSYSVTMLYVDVSLFNGSQLQFTSLFS